MVQLSVEDTSEPEGSLMSFCYQLPLSLLRQTKLIIYVKADGSRGLEPR